MLPLDGQIGRILNIPFAAAGCVRSPAFPEFSRTLRRVPQRPRLYITEREPNTKGTSQSTRRQRGKAATKGEATKGTKGTKRNQQIFLCFCAFCGPPKSFGQQTRIHRLEAQEIRAQDFLLLLCSDLPKDWVKELPQCPSESF